MFLFIVLAQGSLHSHHKTLSPSSSHRSAVLGVSNLLPTLLNAPVCFFKIKTGKITGGHDPVLVKWQSRAWAEYCLDDRK